MIFHFSRSDDEAKGAINYTSSFIAEENRIHSLQIIHIQHCPEISYEYNSSCCFFITTEHFIGLVLNSFPLACSS